MSARDIQLGDFLIETAIAEYYTDIVIGRVNALNEGHVISSWNERYAVPRAQLGDLGRWLERGRLTSIWLHAIAREDHATLLEALRSPLNGHYNNGMLRALSQQLLIGTQITLLIDGNTLPPTTVQALRLTKRPVDGRLVSEATLVIDPVQGPRRVHTMLSTNSEIFPEWHLPVQCGIRSCGTILINFHGG